MEKHGDMFTIDFDKNKDVLNKIAVLRSKNLRNEVAGYITGYMRSGTDHKEKVQEETESEEESES
ncbi:MAG: small subunit ribosomal protein S17e [Candidatus Nitrosomirales archaeon]|jgi:small subunit ribosomal protein S17e